MRRSEQELTRDIFAHIREILDRDGNSAEILFNAIQLRKLLACEPASGENLMRTDEQYAEEARRILHYIERSAKNDDEWFITWILKIMDKSREIREANQLRSTPDRGG